MLSNREVTKKIVGYLDSVLSTQKSVTISKMERQLGVYTLEDSKVFTMLLAELFASDTILIKARAGVNAYVLKGCRWDAQCKLVFNDKYLNKHSVNTGINKLKVLACVVELSLQCNREKLLSFDALSYAPRDKNNVLLKDSEIVPILESLGHTGCIAYRSYRVGLSYIEMPQVTQYGLNTFKRALVKYSSLCDTSAYDALLAKEKDVVVC